MFTIWTATRTAVTVDDVAKTMGERTSQAVDAIQRAYTAVLLCGSKRVAEKANGARRAAWAVHDRLFEPSADQGIILNDIVVLLAVMGDEGREFIARAQADLN